MIIIHVAKEIKIYHKRLLICLNTLQLLTCTARLLNVKWYRKSFCIYIHFFIRQSGCGPGLDSHMGLVPFQFTAISTERTKPVAVGQG